MTDLITDWMSAYRKAWESNDPEDIAALFTNDALYYKEPFTEPVRGHDAIIEMWQEHQDAPGTTSFEWNLLVESASADAGAGSGAGTGDLAIVQGETVYSTVRYSNLWVIRLVTDDGGVGRATEFTEWWMDQSAPS